MDVQPENMKMCTICKKFFSNGKALAGHTRIHSRDSSKGTADELNCGESSKLNNGDGTPVCLVCSKEFRSWKSLYKHMSSHSERQLQAATGKRGREGVSPEMPMDVNEAAEILLELVGKSGMAGGGSGEVSELINVFERPGSGRKKGKWKDPNQDSSLGSGRFRCVTCKRDLASPRVLGRHLWKHTREGSVGSCVSVPSSMVESGSTREVGGIWAMSGAGQALVKPSTQAYPASPEDD